MYLYVWHLLRDCQQITFVTFNSRFCPLSNPPFLTDNSKMDRISTKIKCKIHTVFTLYFNFWRYSWKCVRYSRQIFYFFLFLLAFTSAGIIFLKLLEVHSTISEKNHYLSFFNGFTQTPHPLNNQNPLSMTSFLLMLPKKGKFVTEIFFQIMFNEVLH